MLAEGTTLLFYWVFIIGVQSLELPGNCKPDQYYDPGGMFCLSCPSNVSMVTSKDGFSCTCDSHSVPIGTTRCKQCNATEVVSSDGRSCVPRRCQSNAGRMVCRKCPADYISVTQNFDGSPLKEVLCVKCARGFRADGNLCVRCESCACARNDIVVRGRCVPKKFVNERPKYEDSKLNPFMLLDIVKLEYLCTQNDLLACRALTNECVKNFYSTDLTGPCRLWIQPKITKPKGLSLLTMDLTGNDKIPGELTVTRGMNKLLLALSIFTPAGGFEMLQDPAERYYFPCHLPLSISIGYDQAMHCIINTKKLNDYMNVTLSPFLLADGEFKPLPLSIRKTDDQYVHASGWPSGKFKRYFLVKEVLSTITNVSSTIYLRTLLIRIQIQKENNKSNSLKLFVSVEIQYATKSPHSQNITTSLMVEHEMPSAGVLKGLEILGAVLGSLLSLLACLQWRGAVRRGAPYGSLVPQLSGSIADALYFAAWFSSAHALTAEAGTLGMTLPLSRSEEHMITAFVYSSFSLKALRVVWINWKQCRCDIFFLDWSEYNPPLKGSPTPEKPDWRVKSVAREWNRMQTKRRASLGHTAALTLIILHLMSPWQSLLPQSWGYHWTVATLAWWAAYFTVLVGQWTAYRVAGSPTAVLPNVCKGVGLSLLVFEEEYYAHYIHGRYDDGETRTMAGPLAQCRVVCAQQLRVVFKQLSSPGLGVLGDKGSRQALLSRFLAAFFERALDGLSWVASERTVLERLLDVEVTPREAGNTSALLYDPDDGSPSCFNLTWWGQEWTLGTFDAMLFGCILMAVHNQLIAALIAVVTWQIMKQARSWFAYRNQRHQYY